jgi:hypothetical protein
MGVGDIDLAKCEWIGNRIWVETIGPFMIYMILIIGNGRWIVRPAILGEGIRGYGFEIPVDTRQSEAFRKELKEGELEEIHDHVENQQYHLTVDSL